ncbi:hypothetical protein PoB_007212500 [Plakobranchus ocellatus]|uniref:Uncharacterized protein n=1 Tax=Plakobranchus ocellatus TaxID=259542 RepID=A0AAV4DNW5_9GAST|nr:hypothetical protein PoB_007212500 [Plakobranchus ocellatus]
MACSQSSKQTVSFNLLKGIMVLQEVVGVNPFNFSGLKGWQLVANNVEGYSSSDQGQKGTGRERVPPPNCERVGGGGSPPIIGHQKEDGGNAGHWSVYEVAGHGLQKSQETLTSSATVVSHFYISSFTVVGHHKSASLQSSGSTPPKLTAASPKLLAGTSATFTPAPQQSSTRPTVFPVSPVSGKELPKVIVRE